MLVSPLKLTAAAFGLVAAWLVPSLSPAAHPPPSTDQLAMRNFQSQEAWKTSVRFIDVQLKDWMLRQAHRDRNSYVRMDLLWIKKFAASDIQWDDARHVTVRSTLGVMPSISFPRSSKLYFLWTSRVELESDGTRTWWRPGTPVFQSEPTSKSENLTTGHIDSMATQPLITLIWEYPPVR